METSLLYFHPMFFSIQKRLVLNLVLLFFFLPRVFSQPYYFTHYQVENGLSNNAVMCSLQDHYGFMWFGTRDGLNRFDGLSFKIFRNNAGNPKSIGSNAINCLYEDDSNHIWVGTEKGIYKYNEANEQFTQLKAAGNYSIRNLKVRGDDVWFISLYTLYRYNEKTGEQKTYKVGNEMTSYCLMNDNTLWISTAAGTLVHYNNTNDTFTEYNLFNKSPNAVSKSIESIFDTGTGTLLIGTLNEGLKSFDINTSSYKDIFTLNPDKTEIIVREIIAVTKEEYWIASQSGIYILNIKTGKYKNLAREQNNPYSLSDNIVHTLCKDKEGGIWAGTYFGGINYYPKQYVTFKKYFPASVSNAISGYAVREICNDKEGNIWIGTEDAGLNKFNPVTGLFTIYNTAINKESVSYSNIHGLLVNDDKVWAGTYLHGLDILDAKTGKRIKHYNTGNSSLGSNFIYSLYKLHSGNIMVATDKGVYEYLAGKDSFKMVNEVRKVFYRTIYEESDGTIWAGTYGDGVFFYNNKTGKHGQFLSVANNPDSLPGNLINKIFEDSKHNLWFATEEGIASFDKKQNSFKKFTTANGLPSNVTYSILEDNNNNLWISTSKGLACFSPASEEIKVYTKANGLLTDQFNYSSGYKDEKGQMYFGSVKGLVTFYPDSIVNNTFSPPVFLTGFQVYNKELLIDEAGSPLTNSISFTGSVTLTHAQSSFSIDFAALSYTAPGTIKYAYKMDGLNKNWTYLESNRKAWFTELNPGTYTFKVSAFTSNNVNYGQPALLTIKILPPVWKTWWAYLLYTVILVLLSYTIIRFFINRSKEKQKRKLERLEFEKQQEIYNDKVQFYTNIAHEIRTPLTLIKGPMENLMDMADEMPKIKSSLELMDKNTDRLLYLSSQLLDFRKAEMNGFHVNFAKEDISLLFKEHYLNFKRVAEQKKINLEVHYPESFFAFVDAEAFNKIMNNLWDNTLKYAASKATIKMTSADGESYTFVFKNDGHLIPKETGELIFKSFYRAKETAKLPGTGIGLTLSRSLAELHEGTLMMDFADADVNTFILTLPINPKQTV
jgi:ligand-binding sensor domain-containing protein/signal transduction histidine kinase